MGHGTSYDLYGRGILRGLGRVGIGRRLALRPSPEPLGQRHDREEQYQLHQP